MASSLCSLVITLVLAAALLLHLPPLSSAHGSPSAENLIRRLNLLPRDPVPQSFAGSNGEGSLVETSFRFPGVVEMAASRFDPSIVDLEHYAGYYTIAHSHAARMFYLFFESRGNKITDPVVIWLTGGPGCASELALFFENGPFKINDNMTLAWNDYGWDMVSNIMFVDQPTGTGFSYSSDIRDFRSDSEGLSNDLFYFLQAFFHQHPKYAQNDFYITGESYAGHYIPALGSRIIKGNKAKEGIHINLKGMAIGNGLTDPEIQFMAYADYALQMKLIKDSDLPSIKELYPDCESDAKACGLHGGDPCELAINSCNAIFNKILAIAGDKINVYDIRKECIGELCYDFSNLEKFLNMDSVRSALNVGNITFVSCSNAVQAAMSNDIMRDLEVGIPALLEYGINLLVYAGEYDLICNWLGNHRWVQAMKWSGRENFSSAPKNRFNVDWKESGWIQSYGPLSFIKILEAGHMVPMDQPMVALDMIKRFTRGQLK